LWIRLSCCLDKPYRTGKILRSSPAAGVVRLPSPKILSAGKTWASWIAYNIGRLGFLTRAREMEWPILRSRSGLDVSIRNIGWCHCWRLTSLSVGIGRGNTAGCRSMVGHSSMRRSCRSMDPHYSNNCHQHMAPDNHCSRTMESLSLGSNSGCYRYSS